MTNMRPAIIFVSLLLCITIPSCKKTTTFSGAKVNVLTDLKAGVIYTYTYNSDGTLAAIQKNLGGKTTVQYTSGNVLVDNINANSVTTDATSYTLNSSGYAVSAQGQFNSQHISSTYSYDASGHCIQQKNYSYGVLQSIANYTFPSTVATELDMFDSIHNTHVYDYYTYVTNITNSAGVQNKGEGFLGVSSNNPIAQDFRVHQAGDTFDIISYKYKYDGSSRVDTFSSHNKAGQLIDSMAFTYY